MAVSRKDKQPRSMYVASSDTNTQASSTADRNGGVAKVPPTQVAAREVPARPAVPATHAAPSQPAAQQRSDMI